MLLLYVYIITLELYYFYIIDDYTLITNMTNTPIINLLSYLIVLEIFLGLLLYLTKNINYIVFLMILVFILFAYVFNIKYRNNIRFNNKINRDKLQLIKYEYGHLSDNISFKLNINNSLFPIDNPINLNHIFYNICINYKKLPYYNIINNNSVIIDLFWYLSISTADLKKYTYHDLTYILTMSESELLKKLPENYKEVGNMNLACLYFALLTGQYIPKINEEIKRDTSNYTPLSIYNLTFYKNLMIDNIEGKYCIFGPYLYLSYQENNKILDLLSNISIDNYKDIIKQYEICNEEYIESLYDNEKITYLKNELSSYDNYINREDKQLKPVNLVKSNDIYYILSFYSNKEIVEYYEPRFPWKNREELFNVIYKDITENNKWSTSNKYCQNDNTMNILSTELHKDIDKNKEFTYSYGKHKNYDCYQEDELELSFSESFIVPDKTNTLFPIYSIKQLQEIIPETHESFIKTVDNTLKLATNAKLQINKVLEQYKQFNIKEKELINNYLIWMFLYGMWMRFWKGPGNPWPINVKKLENLTNNEERNENVFIQQGIRTKLLEKIETNNKIKDWIDNIIIIYFNFNEEDMEEPMWSSKPIKTVLDNIALGTYCMGFGSDTILKTSYYYIINIIDNDINKVIKNKLNELLDIEYDVIKNLISFADKNTDRYRYLNNKLLQIGNNYQYYIINFNEYTNNNHIEN